MTTQAANDIRDFSDPEIQAILHPDRLSPRDQQQSALGLIDGETWAVYVRSSSQDPWVLARPCRHDEVIDIYAVQQVVKFQWNMEKDPHTVSGYTRRSRVK